MLKIILFLLPALLHSSVEGTASLNLPSNMPQRLYCFGCIATVKEVEKLVSKRRLTKANRASKIVEILETICDSPNRFVAYEYSPPKTVKACKLLMENIEDDIETAFIKNQQKNMVDYICKEISRACEGIDTKEEKQPADHADLDLKDDGDGRKSQTITVDPVSGKVEQKKAPVKKAKTMSKKAKKKKSKNSKKTRKGEKGSLHHLNVDINDPSSMEKVMEQIKKLSAQGKDSDAGKKDKKDEL